MDSTGTPATADSPSTRELPLRYTTENPLQVDRWMARLPIPRAWTIAVLGIIFLLAPAVLAYWSGITSVATLFADYRAQFIYALLLVYLLAVIPILERSNERVVKSLRPLTQLNDDDFQAIVSRASTVAPSRELLAFVIGMAVGLTINMLFEPLPEDPNLLDIYAYWSRVGIFGLIGWGCYTLPFSSRITNAVLKQPIAVEPLNLSPFEPIGRQSLLVALIVLGVMVLSLLSASIYNRSLWAEYVLLYGAGVIGIFFLFFWNMRGVHRLLVATKRNHLDSVEQNIARAYTELQRRIARNEDTLSVATELNALVAAKHQLQETRTWPFNTETLSALSAAVLAPLFIAIARFLAMFLGR